MLIISYIISYLHCCNDQHDSKVDCDGDTKKLPVNMVSHMTHQVC